MKKLKQTYVLQDRLTKQPKMYKAMTLEESFDANELLRSHESTSQWVQVAQAVDVPEGVSNSRAA